MSTRSGKRIHNSLHENFDSIANTTSNSMFCKTEKKTRSKRLKENMEDEEYACASKKKQNYVAYPGNNVNDADTVTVTAPRGKTRKSRKHILQEHDINKIIREVDSEGHDECTVPKKTGRLTRQTKKFNEDIENAELSDVSYKKNRKVILKEINGMDSTNTATKKKLKKKKQVITPKENKVVDTEAIITKKKSKKKKKGNKISTNTVDIFITDNTNKTLNKSRMSVDSFHSAAGSPASEPDINTLTGRRSGKLLISGTTSQDIFMSLDEEITCDQSVKQTGKCKTSIKVDEMVDGNKQKYEDEACNMLLISNNENIDKISDKPKWSINPDGNTVAIINTPNNEIANVIAVEPCNINKIDRSFLKVNKTPNSSVSNVSETINVTDSFSTSANVKEVIDAVEFNNSANKQRRSRRLSHLDPESPSSMTKLSIKKSLNDKKQLERTFENITPKLNSTFDKQDEKFIHKATNPDTTFDKSDEQITSKSSLISSDGELNGTYNKTNDISRISITSDESKTENIINTTPVLIESSLDNTQLEGTPMKTDAKEAKTTPLKREGTFTKDDTDNITSLLPEMTNTSSGSVTVKTPKKDSLTRTPDKGTSLGTPGSTPFPFSKTSQKKSVLNVTHSIEKARSSLAECAPRTTRVMFCSPIDFPLPTTESKRRIVKSSVKGSNKSFVFDNSECARPSPAQGRKRSFTHDEDGERAKRTRLADDLLQSVERLSRPRTNSATGKLGSSTPGNKPVTPSRPRTKLPNFAALHQKQFAKMESLDECQDRKARRAKHLLVPTGSVAVLDRSSPKATDSPRKSKEPKTKKTVPELKQGDTTLPSYTRFGFKMNIAGGNPFSVPPKDTTTVVKPKEKKPNGANTRTTLPSRAGGTLVRKDVAKQIIMREKSFNSLSSKCDSKRTQNRTIIKGVRTNRRFELQMQMRNVDA